VEIAGLIIRSMPKNVSSVVMALCRIEGTEVHYRDQVGKLIVTTEHDSEKDLRSAINQIQDLDNILSAAMVYQHSDEIQHINQQEPAS